jgi:hypothetical protein
LVRKESLELIEGFDERFSSAGGEDIDLAFRLLRIGTIEYQWKSIVSHSFDDGLVGFIKRFRRYGDGNARLALKYNLPLAPRMFLPEKLGFVNLILAFVQFVSMRSGYNNYISRFVINAKASANGIRRAAGQGDYDRVLAIWKEHAGRSSKDAIALHGQSGIPFLVVSASNWKEMKTVESDLGLG